MPRNRAALWSCTLLMLPGLVALGCSGNPAAAPGVNVTGKVVQGGQPLTAERLPPGEFVAEVAFVPLDASGTRDVERVQSDGSFKEMGAGKGIKAGKYRLAITHFINGRGTDGLDGKFSDKVSPITVEIPPNKVGSTHDLGTIELNDYKSK